MVTINYEKCIGCLKCVNGWCPSDNFSAVDGKPVFNPEHGCVKCMHCALLCPENAISLDGDSMVLSEELPIVEDTFSDDLTNFLMMRRSYRKFKAEPVPEDELCHALDVAAWAPSAKNNHMTRYFIVSGRDKIDKITDIVIKDLEEKGDWLGLLNQLKEGHNRIFGEAPSVIIAYSKKTAVNPQVDATLALSYAELVLQSKGFGTCWSGYFTTCLKKIEKLQELFPIKEGYDYYGCLLVGYPNEEFLYIPERIKRPDIKEGNF